MANPEAEARKNIDRLLEQAGWVIQDYEAFNRNAALGVAVREFPLPSGAADYLLFIEGKAAGAIEAKPEGVTLSGVSEQGSTVEAGFEVGKRERRTRRTTWNLLDQDLTYGAKDLDRSVTAPDVIRKNPDQVPRGPEGRAVP